MSDNPSLDDGPFFHGTSSYLAAGDRLVAGHRSNCRPEVVMNHVYFTAFRDGAGLAAEIAVMLGAPYAEPHVYLVAPTGDFENDPMSPARSSQATQRVPTAQSHCWSSSRRSRNGLD